MSRCSLCCTILLFCLFSACSDVTEPKSFRLTIFQTNDIHSHWLGRNNCDYDPQTTGDGTLGGVARMATKVEEARSESSDVLLLDAGDFSMGTMFAAAKGGAGDLDLMADLGFDAAALGNHEFDRFPAGLAQILQNTAQPAVPLLCANIRFDPDSPEDDALEALYGPEGEAGKRIHPYVVHELPSGKLVGIFGLMGIDAMKASNAGPVRFSENPDDLAATAQAVVDELREQEAVDLVVLLAHLGLKEDADGFQGESAELARQVDGIDIILSGHEHSVAGPAEIECENGTWKTVVMEAGSYDRQVGRYQVTEENGIWQITAEMIQLDDSIPGEPGANEAVDQAIADLEQNYLSQFPGDYDFFQVLAESDCDIERHHCECNNMGNLVADAAREASGSQIAVISNGHDIRDSLYRSKDEAFCLAEVFNACPMGQGLDGLLGSPLVKYHLSLSMVAIALQVATAGEGSPDENGNCDNDMTLQISGLRIEYYGNPGFGQLARMVMVENLDESDPGTVLYDENGWQVDDQQLVSVTTSIDIALQLGSAGLSPLDAQGNPFAPTVENLAAYIVRDNQGGEIKMWVALAQRIESLQRQGLHQYCDDLAINPLGAPWRRCRDLNLHP